MITIRNQRIVSTVNFVFFETRLFAKILSDYLDDNEYRALQNTLLENPEIGEVMPGTGGFRKMRWKDPKRGKGKRGGLRIIYYVLESDCLIWFFMLYDKDEMTDLSGDQKKALKLAIQKELKDRR